MALPEHDPALSAFVSADSLVPAPGNPQTLNRYAYALSNPLKYTDPSGHWVESALDIAFLAYDLWDISQNGLNWENGLALAADVGGLLLPVATGGGLAVRAAFHADDAARLVTHSDDVLRIVNAADNGADTLNRVDDLVDTGVALDNVTDVTTFPRKGPDFVVTPGGEAIPIPKGATGPTTVETGRGFQYTGGSGGNGLDVRVSDARIMDPTPPRGPSPGYPGGYVSYSNARGQTVNPYTGQTIPKTDRSWHMPLIRWD